MNKFSTLAVIAALALLPHYVNAADVTLTNDQAGKIVAQETSATNLILSLNKDEKLLANPGTPQQLKLTLEYQINTILQNLISGEASLNVSYQLAKLIEITAAQGELVNQVNTLLIQNKLLISAMAAVPPNKQLQIQILYSILRTEYQIASALTQKEILLLPTPLTAAAQQVSAQILQWHQVISATQTHITLLLN